MNKRRKRGNNKLRLLVRRFVWRIKHRKCTIDIGKIPQGRPSTEQVKLNRWRFEEMRLLGLIEPYESGSGHKESGNSCGYKVVMTQFKSLKEYSEAKVKALMLLEEFKPIPEPMRTRLILETENLRKQAEKNR